MATRGVLFFDLDGTIADSGAGIHASLNEVFESHDSEPLTIEELHTVIGPPLQESLPTLLLHEESRMNLLTPLFMSIEPYIRHIIFRVLNSMMG